MTGSSGHYVCYVRGLDDEWRYFNDEYNRYATLDEVLEQNPYTLFYRKRQAKDA